MGSELVWFEYFTVESSSLYILRNKFGQGVTTDTEKLRDWSVVRLVLSVEICFTTSEVKF